MIARAPGKLVLSGAYAVLEGAPAIVAAVDRYVIADAARPPERVTEEVQAAIDLGVLDRPAWFDAGALRAGDQKLGLGSSAAILVATMAARAAARGIERGLGPPFWDGAELFAGALAAHRRAQGGGSGVDVAASVHGGVLCFTLLPESTRAPSVTPHALPSDLVVTVLSSDSAARTSALLGRVRALEARDPAGHRALLDEAARGARAAAIAKTAASFAAALDCQVDALTALGDRAGAPIVTAALRALRPAAAAEQAALAPSGAGGGDVAIFAGPAPPSAAFLARARAAGLTVAPMAQSARGVHCTSPIA